MNIKKGTIKLLKSCSIKSIAIIIAFIFVLIVIDNAKINCKELKSDKIKNSIFYLTDICNLIKNKIPCYKCILYLLLIFMIILLIAVVRFKYYCNESKEEFKKEPKRIIQILGHTTFKESQFTLSDKVLKEVVLDISNQLNLKEDIDNMNLIKEDMKYIVRKQDDFIKRFKQHMSNSDYYGYMGISHTPLILRAGNKIGDGVDFILFHKERYKNYYQQLNDNELYPKLNIEETINPNSKELLVTIATSFPIKDYQLEILNPKNKNLLKFMSDELDIDILLSRKQLEEYVHMILHEMRSFIANNRINKIHMVISSSVALTFALGQRISCSYFPEVIIYNFDISNKKYYTWGISLFKNYNDCLIIN
ncbi:SAVED domain-containing protein [Clostridium sporogenes]|uniref:SAVED domain-containing protein n=1 Tax=Clostridium sporogenes TaxID=1509 RepID=UPI0006B27DB3|nr:SAVED domain-containing protein [Clostridium sporogenes]KOY65395.1 hypothetical protein AN649_13015 [Clostridium sporogenes]MDS1006676.1 SAVED domain-containing protein [Clostridium sporogenes]